MIPIEKRRGFTLIELLIVISILAVLAAIVFVALDPATRFKDTRDTRRFSDVAELLHAIKINQVDNDGAYISTITALTDGNIYMIGTGLTACAANPCDAAVTSNSSCVSLAALVSGGYIESVPISPTGVTTWTAVLSGYPLSKTSTGAITIQACESENAPSVTLTR